jgi:hypothetical protein
MKVLPQAAARRLGTDGTSLPPRLLDHRCKWSSHVNASIHLHFLRNHDVLPEMLFLETMMVTAESQWLGRSPETVRGTILQICDCNSHGRPESTHLDYALCNFMSIYLR